MVTHKQTETVVSTPPLGETIQKIAEALEPYDKSTRRRIIESIKILMTDRDEDENKSKKWKGGTNAN